MPRKTYPCARPGCKRRSARPDTLCAKCKWNRNRPVPSVAANLQYAIDELDRVAFREWEREQ